MQRAEEVKREDEKGLIADWRQKLKNLRHFPHWFEHCVPRTARRNRAATGV